jgi:hypothetical protein
MSKVFQIPILVTGVKTTADKALEIKIHTRDVATFKNEHLASIMEMLDKEYWAAFSELEIKAEEIEVGEERVDRGNKTQAQRLRSVIFRLWEKTNQEQDSETYYRSYMESLINKLKDKIDE